MNIKDSTQFMGFFLANSAFSFLFIWFFLGILITPFCMYVLWKTIYQNVNLIYGILSLQLVATISYTLGKKFVIGKDSIKHRRCWSYFELHILFVSLIPNMTASVARIIMGFVAGLIGMTRIDKPILPKFILEKENYDE